MCSRVRSGSPQQALRNEHSRSSTDVSAKTIELVSTQTENTRLRQALDEKSLEVAKLRSTVDKLKSDARRVSDFASQSRTVNQDLVRGLHEQVAIVTADRDSLQSQLEEARAKGRAAHTRAEAMTERVQLLEGELERLQRYTDAEVRVADTCTGCGLAVPLLTHMVLSPLPILGGAPRGGVAHSHRDGRGVDGASADAPGSYARCGRRPSRCLQGSADRHAGPPC